MMHDQFLTAQSTRWIAAVNKARKALGVKGFVAIKPNSLPELSLRFFIFMQCVTARFSITKSYNEIKSYCNNCLH